jgi:hypothetical protein
LLRGPPNLDLAATDAGERLIGATATQDKGGAMSVVRREQAGATRRGLPRRNGLRIDSASQWRCLFDKPTCFDGETTSPPAVGRWLVFVWRHSGLHCGGSGFERVCCVARLSIFKHARESLTRFDGGTTHRQACTFHDNAFDEVRRGFRGARLRARRTGNRCSGFPGSMGVRMVVRLAEEGRGLPRE